MKQGISPVVLLALQNLAHHDAPVCVEAILDIFAAQEVAFFPTARRILAGYRHPKSLAELVRKGTGHRDSVVRAQALLALGEGRSEDIDWSHVVGKGLSDPQPVVRAAAVFALGRARVPGYQMVILDLAADPSERVRMEVPEALFRLIGDRSLPMLVQMSSDERWRVRLASIRAMANLKTRRATSALADLLDSEKGRLREDIVIALQRLTGRTFGFDSSEWKLFLQEAPEDFLSHADIVAFHTPRYAGGLTYYTVQTASLNFVLLTDLSGSMSALAQVVSGYEHLDRPRIEIAKLELERLIGTLKEEVSFNLIGFNGKIHTWRKDLVQANPRQTTEALSEVRNYHADGGTNLFEIFKNLYDDAEKGLDSPVTRTVDVDTVFLLTDGIPSSGHISSTDLLLSYVEQRHRTSQIKIHCLSLSEDVNAGFFLQRLAEITGGVFAPLVESD
ncbi:MAG: HEAT repeat domain-containing protein [Planctomycetota bacterium]|nr:HEAT repeat domain-containing protein [Planctomycetota bacterium]